MPTPTVAEPAATPRPTRRRLLRGAAWAAPTALAAVAAPSLALSCQVYAAQIDWDAAGRYTRESVNRGVYTLPLPGRDPLVLTVTADWGTKGSSSDALSVVTSQTGVAGTLNLAQAQSSSVGRSTAATITFSFNQPVENLRFTLSDIDGLTSSAGQNAQEAQGNERVVLSPGFTYSYADADYLTGAGTSASPFRVKSYPDYGNPNDPGQTWGDVDINYPGTISSFTMTAWIELRPQLPNWFVEDMIFDLDCPA